MKINFFQYLQEFNISRICDNYIKTFILIDIIGFFNILEN